MTTDPHMISDAALNALYSDADTVTRMLACPYTGEMQAEVLEKIRSTKPDQERAFLLAAKRNFYRDTAEYTQAAMKARVKAKPRPAPRPMAGFGSRSYRSW